MKFEIFPESQFITCSEYEIENDQRLTIPNGAEEEAYLAFRVEKVGEIVNQERVGEAVLLPNDIVLAKRSNVNFVYFMGQDAIYIEHAFAIKIKIIS
jgi:hypothetical protein